MSPAFAKVALAVVIVLAVSTEVFPITAENENVTCTHCTRKIQNEPCPPGFSGNPCECQAVQYNCIYKCNSKRAYILNGYWVGICRDGSICTSHCPLGFCKYNHSELPETAEELEEFICGRERRGVLCGECQPDYSVNYHSYNYKCSENTLCNVGWLLYIISELLPLTVVFIFVMTFNISFTSGALNGFILFAQLQDSLAVHGNGVIPIPPGHEFFVAFQRLTYRFFNFEFFSIEKLSFCLWRDATVLDAMAFKYVTVVYALILVFICIFVMSSSRVRRTLTCLRPKSLRSTTIHGLTTFFIMCFSQCARVSIQIIGPAYLYKMGPEYVETVVFRSGQFKLFEPRHLRYALPAIFFISTLLIPPPVILILYPLTNKILARCNLSEAKACNFITKYIPIQLFDAFQSCFKDEFRFFAGLYFFYRIATMVAFATSRTLTQFYTVLEMLLVIALALHSVVQPYKERWHNITDSLLLANLAIINGLSLYNYQRRVQDTVSYTSTTTDLQITLALQLLLIYLPLIGITMWCLVKIVRKIKKVCVAKKLVSSGIWQAKQSKLYPEHELPPLRDEDTELRTANYRKIAS